MEKGRLLPYWYFTGLDFYRVFVAISRMCLEAQGEKDPVKAPE